MLEPFQPVLTHFKSDDLHQYRNRTVRSFQEKSDQDWTSTSLDTKEDTPTHGQNQDKAGSEHFLHTRYIVISLDIVTSAFW
jgi:hypothetical protein